MAKAKAATSTNGKAAHDDAIASTSFEVVPLDSLHLDGANVRQHPDDNRSALESSLAQFGPARSIVLDGNDVVRAGNGTVEAAHRAGITEVLIVDPKPGQMVAVRRKDWSPTQATAYGIADNAIALKATWDEPGLAAQLRSLQSEDFDLTAVGYEAGEVDALIEGLAAQAAGSLDGAGEAAEDPGAEPDRAEELLAKWRCKRGDLWVIESKTTPGREHRLLCGDSTDAGDVARLMGGEKIQGAFTSPPYAEQRKDQYGGTPADRYVDWWDAIQANVKAHIKEDGSFFVNIKAHCEDGERSLYVMDLVLAMKRRWDWKYVDEFCWARGAVPGKYPGRFKNGFEPVHHFAIGKPKLDQWAVAHESDDVMTGDRTSHRTDSGFGDKRGERISGLALPSNVLDIPAVSSHEVCDHSAAFPIALPEFFLNAFSDPGDLWYEPFCGSGTTLVAAEKTGRLGLGIELLPKYVAVILERLAGLGLSPRLAD